MKKIFTLLSFIDFISLAVGQTADFTYQSTSGLYCSPSHIKFNVTASGSPTGYVWNFGNGSGSNSEGPIATYTTSGTFTVRLIVIYKKNTVQVSKTITINPGIVAHITADRNNICTPGPIHFTANVNEGISSYEWNFGDNTPSISTTIPTVTHSFSDFSTYPISLKAIAPTGCYGESFTTVAVERPAIAATVSPLSGCIPVTVHFNASVSLPAGSSVLKYIWDFGGGASLTTTVANTTHTYTSVGNYTPRLHIITNDGCSNDFIFPQIAFGIPPTNHVAYPKKTTICGSESLACVSKATNANKFFWDFGEGDTTSVTDTIIQHKFRTLGTKTITVTPLFNDCPGTPISFSINVIGVIAGFDYANTCSNKKAFAFSNISQGNQSTVIWEFGDGSPALHANNFIHSYPDTGTFITSLAVTDNITGCADTYTRNIYTAFPSLTNPDSSLCKNSNTTFNIPANYNNPDATYSWNVVGIEASGSSLPFTINASVLGNFNNNYVVINNGSQYCPDTIKLKNKILVRGPLLDFTIPAEICLAKPFNIVNSSAPFVPTDIINYWHWDYGIPGESDSVFQPQPYYYPYWGLPFNVKLTAIDMNGCMDSLVKPVMVYDIPFLRSIPDMDTLCAGKQDTLIAFHNDPIIWSPANSLSCATCDTIIVNPSVSTTYYVSAKNRFNCIVTDSIPIYVYPHFTAVPAKADNYICTNESVKLEVMPSDKIIRWEPPIGLSDNTIFNPVATPRESTVYTVTLTDSAGCFSSSANVNVHLKSLPVVNAGPDKTYPYNTPYSFAPTYSNNVSEYVWTPAAHLDCSTCAIPSCVATTTQTYTVTAISDSGCIAKDNITISIECKYANLLLPEAFSPNHDNLNDYFYPITRGIKKIVRFSIYNRMGQLVFDRKDFDPNICTYGWDGNLKGLPEPTSTFVYTLEAVCEAGETISKKGTVVLLR